VICLGFSSFFETWWAFIIIGLLVFWCVKIGVKWEGKFVLIRRIFIWGYYWIFWFGWDIEAEGINQLFSNIIFHVHYLYLKLFNFLIFYICIYYSQRNSI